MTLRIAVIPGDGIGPEVTRAAMQVLEAAADRFGLDVCLDWYDYGADKYLREGVTLPPEDLERLKTYSAIFLGALGDPRVPDMKHAADILFGIRFGLDLYANVRPVKLLDPRLCPLKGVERLDFVVLRENTEGLYAGMGGIFKKGTPDEVAIQEDVNTRKGVERIIRYAFEYARARGYRSVCMSDKSNALRYAGDLWQRTFWAVAAEYPDIQAWHLYIDALAMQMVKRPQQFEVIVTNNMFGDIVSDLGAQLQGGLGMAPSGNIHPGRVSMFEPVHGSAPKYAGQNVANPMAAVLTAGMMMEYLGFPEVYQAIEAAVVAALRAGVVTRDLAEVLGVSPWGTREVGAWLAEYVRRGAP
ncbi:putative tartrate dehydrogenase/decarboxylase TtuC' [bacterium HR11]|nr:putative tartrate dehydrogenase/decarboxylase TtuC' [bacterium HR11]